MVWNWFKKEKIRAVVVKDKNDLYRVQLRDSDNKVLMLKSGRSFKTSDDAEAFGKRLAKAKIE